MHIREVEQDDTELSILAGLITDTDFLREMQEVVKPEWFKLPYSKFIYSWCREYYYKYKEAPNQVIQNIWEDKLPDLDPIQGDLIERFLSNLSEAHVPIPTKYLLDKSEKYLSKRALLLLNEELKQCALRGDIEGAEALIANYKRVERHQEGGGVDVIRDIDAIVQAHEKQNEDTLFQLPGAYGELIGGFKREELYSFVASAKKGKTWMLQDIAIRAMFKGFNVIFLQLEMSKTQMLTRIHTSLNGAKISPVPYVIKQPVFDCIYNQTGKCDLPKRVNDISLLTKDGGLLCYGEHPDEYSPCTVCRGSRRFVPTSWFKTIKKPAHSIEDRKITIEDTIRKIKDSRFKLYTFPVKTLTFSKVYNILNNLEYYEGFVPDIIIIDYLDNMALPYNRYSEKEALTAIWTEGKGLAQQKKAALITASQSNTARTGKDVAQGDWGGDINKLALIDVGVAINQSDEEYEKGIIRLKNIADRDASFSPLREVMVLRNLDIGVPVIDSCFI